MQEAYHWLASVRFRDLRSSTTEFGSGLLGGGTVYLIGVQPSDGDALSAVQILTMAAWPSAACSSTGWTRRIWTVCGQFSTT